MPREPTSKGLFVRYQPTICPLLHHLAHRMLAYQGPDSELSNTFALPNELPGNGGEPSHTVSVGSSQHTGGTWSDIASWSYSAVRLQ